MQKTNGDVTRFPQTSRQNNRPVFKQPRVVNPWNNFFFSFFDSIPVAFFCSRTVEHRFVADPRKTRRPVVSGKIEAPLSWPPAGLLCEGRFKCAPGIVCGNFQLLSPLQTTIFIWLSFQPADALSEFYCPLPFRSPFHFQRGARPFLANLILGFRLKKEPFLSLRHRAVPLAFSFISLVPVLLSLFLLSGYLSIFSRPRLLYCCPLSLVVGIISSLLLVSLWKLDWLSIFEWLKVCSFFLLMWPFCVWLLLLSFSHLYFFISWLICIISEFFLLMFY